MSESHPVGQRVWWMHVLLIGAGLIVFAPVVWIVGAGFRTQISLLMGEFWFTPVLMNFEEVLFSKTSEYLLNFWNSCLIGGLSTILCLTVATLGAYSIHRMRWRPWVTHSVLGWALLFHMIPPIALAGAWFAMFRTVGLDNTYTALVLGHATLNLPMALWLMGVFMREVPIELEEAARIDGATTPELLWKVIVPLVMPGMMATAVLAFVFSWNEFPVALSLSMKQTATVPVAIAKYAQEYEIKYSEMAASAALSIIPALILLLLGQRFIVKGLTAGAVK
jgi:multiple sugar transport system permease protein